MTYHHAYSHQPHIGIEPLEPRDPKLGENEEKTTAIISPTATNITTTMISAMGMS